MYAILSLVFSLVMLASTTSGLFRTFTRERDPLYVLLAVLYVMALIVWAIVRVACPYERLWLCLALAGGFLAGFKGSLPAVAARAIGMIKLGSLILWSGATIVSMWFTYSAYHSDPPGPKAG
jgi:hypothetical protein